MKAVYYMGDFDMQMRDIPSPVPQADEYLVKIDACSVCGSDVEGYLGKTGRRVAPMIMGHECAGTIVEAPAGGKLDTGCRVAIFPKLFCGVCDTCKSGLMNLCPNGEFLGVMACDGAMTEYICVKEQYLLPYGNVGADIASLAEPAAVAYNAVYKLTDEEIASANHILVVGAGTIGLMALLWLKYRGAKHIIVSDVSDFRLELATRMGAHSTINPAIDDFPDGIRELTNGELCDISIEAVGISPTAQSAIEALRPAARSIWIGNAAKMVNINMQYVVTKELNIQGNYIYSLEDFKECVRLLSEKAIDVSRIITHHMDMSKGVEAFEMLRSNQDGRAVKIVLTND